MRAQLLAIPILLASMSAAAPAAQAQPLQPTEKWVVNFDDSQCLASRNYGTRAAPLLLGLKAPPLGDVMQLMIVRPGTGGPFADQLPVTITTDGGQPFATTMLAFGVNEDQRRVYRVNLPVEQFAPLKSAKTLSIRAGTELDQTFALGDMQPLLNVMDRCVKDLREVWNIHPGAGPNPELSRPATSNVAELVVLEDFPAIAIQQATGGSVTLAMLIDERGRVADCTVIETSGIAVLDAQSCAKAEERAQFTPAIGADGAPAKSSWVQEVSWPLVVE